MTDYEKNIQIKKEGGILYFIEDTKTNLWYRIPDNYFVPMIHTFGQGWNRQPDLLRDFWTNDPQEAKAFHSKDKAEIYAEESLKTFALEWQDYVNKEYIKKSIKITEHEFVSNPSNY